MLMGTLSPALTADVRLVSNFPQVCDRYSPCWKPRNVLLAHVERSSQRATRRFLVASVLLSFCFVSPLDSSLVRSTKDLFHLVLRNIFHATHDVVFQNERPILDNLGQPLGVLVDWFILGLRTLCKQLPVVTEEEEIKYPHHTF